jgi:hypothetical protein
MKLAIVAAALMLAGTGAPQSAPPNTMNRYQKQPRCASIPQQVAGEDRRYNGTRLDRQPPGQLLLAVDRQVDGCHEAVLMRDELRRRGR